MASVGALWDSEYGGTVSSGGGVIFFSSHDQAFEAGVAYVNQHNGWDNTERGFYGAVEEYARSQGGRVTRNADGSATTTYNRYYSGYNYLASDPGQFYYWSNFESMSLILEGPGDAQNGGTSDDNLLWKMYWHYQVGGGNPLEIDASTLDFSETNQKALGLEGMKVGETREPINLFNAGIDSKSLAFGKVVMTYQGNNQFSISPNRFDWNIEYSNPFTISSLISWRNRGTALGVVITNFAPLTPMIFGGPYDVIFNGTVVIPK